MAWYDFIVDPIKSVGNAVKSVGNTVYNGAIKPAYDKILKPVGETTYNSVLKPVMGIAGGAVTRVIGQVNKFNNVGDKLLDAGANVATGVGNAAVGVGDFLNGNSNVLLWIGLGIGGLIVVSKLADKVL